MLQFVIVLVIGQTITLFSVDYALSRVAILHDNVSLHSRCGKEAAVVYSCRLFRLCNNRILICIRMPHVAAAATICSHVSLGAPPQALTPASTLLCSASAGHSCCHATDVASTHRRQRTDNRQQTTNGGRRTANDRRQATNDRRQATDDRRQTTNDRRQATNDR